MPDITLPDVNIGKSTEGVTADKFIWAGAALLAIFWLTGFRRDKQLQYVPSPLYSRMPVSYNPRRNPDFNYYKAEIARISREGANHLDKSTDKRSYYSDHLMEIQNLVETLRQDKDLTGRERGTLIDLISTQDLLNSDRYLDRDIKNMKDAYRQSAFPGEEYLNEAPTYEEWLKKNRHFRSNPFKRRR